MAILRTIIGFLLTLLFGWLRALVILWTLLRDRLLRLLARNRLPGRSRKGADSHCVPIRHPSYRQPDPLIYSQPFLMSLGLAVTWDNPDIELQYNGVPVPSSSIQPDTEYEIVARIWNASTDAPIVHLPVRFSYLEFGVTTKLNEIDSGKPAYVDLGVKGGPGCPGFATKKWRSPALAGHYCIQVLIDWLDDANPLNNLGQENLNVGVATSPAHFAFALRNDGPERRVYRFATDGYGLPEAPSCERVPARTRKQRVADGVRPAMFRVLPALPAEVRARHDQAAHPVPPGWRVVISPAEVPLEPDQQQTIQVDITPPDGWTGRQPVNVRALHHDAAAGGVTLVVERS